MLLYVSAQCHYDIINSSITDRNILMKKKKKKNDRRLLSISRKLRLKRTKYKVCLSALAVE